MRILLVNPNMTAAMTDTMARVARQTAGTEAEIVAITADRGFPYVASRAEAQIAGGIALDMIAANMRGIDAVVMAAFGDPGLRGARELFDLPVVGMAEAAMMTAAMLGERFSIVTFSPVMRRWYLDCAQDSGLMARCAGVRTPTHHPDNLGDMQVALRDDLIGLSRLAVLEDHADVIILGGAPLAGMAPDIASEVPGIVIDPIATAVAQAIALVRVTTAAGFPNRSCKPIPKSSVGLGTALAGIVGGNSHA